MPYRVKVPRPLVEAIRAIRPAVGSEVAEHLRVLERRPHLGTPIRGEDFDGTMHFRMRIHRPPLSREFAVLYEFDPNEEDILILDFCCLDGEPPRRSPPGFEKPADS